MPKTERKPVTNWRHATLPSPVRIREMACPFCRAEEPRFLSGASRDSSVHYYLCRHCGYTWSEAKDDPNAAQSLADETPRSVKDQDSASA